MDYNKNIKYDNYLEKDIEQFEVQQKEEKLSLFFNKLYRSINPQCPNNYILPKNFQNFLRRILSTNFSIIKKDEILIINSLLDKVYKSSNYNKEIMNRFQYLYSKLTKKKKLTNRWGILYMLNYLSNSNSRNLNFSETNKLQQNYLREINNNILPNFNCIDFILLNNNKEKHENNYINKYNSDINNLNKNNYKDYNINCSNKCKNYLNNLSPISDINEKYCENENLMMCSDKINNKQKNSPIIIEPKKTSLTITEKDIINDLLFVFEGINGKYISYDAEADAFILNRAIPWSEEIYNIINSLSELGWLYKKIKIFIDYFKASNIKSQFLQSFIYSIQNELNEYFKLISLFRKMNLENKSGYEIGKKALNLKNLILWTLNPKEKLKWIAYCCESVYTLKGPLVLSQIYSFVKYGGCNEHLNNILNEVSKPFINFIINWIKYGELKDPYNEFFVDILSNIREDDIWNFKYQIIGKNIPNFMKRNPTLKIFEVGKCIHFIRNYCNEQYNLSNLKNILIYLIEKSGKLNKNDINNNYKEKEEIENINNNYFNDIQFDYGFDDNNIIYEIESIHSCYEFINYLFNSSNQSEILNISFIDKIINNIDIIHKLINKDLVRIIFEKFKFLENFESINKYLLLGQGDMMQTLIESLFDELDKPANQIFKHNLQSILESAIRASNSHIKDSENIKNLNIKLINPSPGDSGWDIFCLEYKVDLPLNIIFSSKLLKDYQKLFLFFWKIKHIKFGQINKIWKKIRSLNIYSKNKNYIQKCLKIPIQFNHEIVHFISNFHNYFALEILETQYKKLKNELSKINNLDELISKHKQFVENIKKQCLLNEESFTINKKIFSIFDIILKFKTSFDMLSSSLEEMNYEYLDNNENDNVYINPNRMKNIKLNLKQIIILHKDFQNQIIEFINLLNIVGRNNLKYLSMKIDFNYFYTLIEKEEEDKKNLLAIKNINDEKERRRIINEEDDEYYNDININQNNENNTNNSNINNEKRNYNYINNNINNIKNANNISNAQENEEEEIDEHDNHNYYDDEENNLYNNRVNNKIENKKNNLSNRFDNNKQNINVDYNGLNNIETKINNKMYLSQKRENNILENPNEYSDQSKRPKKYYIYNDSNDYPNNKINNIDSNNNDYLLKNQNEQKTYQYGKNNLQEKGLNFNYKDNEEINSNTVDIDDEDQIISGVKPKIISLASRSKDKYRNKNK